MQDEWVIARVFQKPGVVHPVRKNRLSSAAGDASCFSDSTSASSAPRPLLTDASLFAAAESGGSYGYGVASANATANNASNNNLVTGRELVPCFSTSAAPPILGIGQYNPAPLAFEPPASTFFTNRNHLRSLQEQDNMQHLQPLFLTAGGAHHHPWGPAGGMEVKLEAAMGRAAPPPQMAVGPGQLDGAYSWGF
jgi:hypothetical protein